MSSGSSPQKIGISRSKSAQQTKSLNQMELTVSKTLELSGDCGASIAIESSNFYEQWLRLSSSVVEERLFGSTDKKVDKIYSFEAKYVSAQAQSIKQALKA